MRLNPLSFSRGAERWVGLVPGLVELGALILIGLVIARLFWLVLAPGGLVSDVTPPPALNAVQVSQATVRSADRSVLIRSNAFAAIETVPAEAAVEDVPETSLNLVLKGLRAASGEGAMSSATIVTPDNEVGVYGVGAEIIDGVVLTRILSDRVILDKNGTFESLFLEGRTGELNVIGGGVPRQAVGGQEVIEPSIHRVESFTALMRDVRLQRASSPPGWRIMAPGNPGALAQFGLEQGDLLTSVNGQEAESLTYDDLAGLIGGSDRVDLSVRRGTETKRVTLVFEERNER